MSGISNDFAISSSPDVPLHILDAHLLAHFLIVVEPLALLQIDIREYGGRLETFGLPLSLHLSQQEMRTESRGLCVTSALNSVNSRPRQSSSMMLTFLGGELCV